MRYEFAVFHYAYPDEPHRGPYDTFSEAQDWVDEAVVDGFREGICSVKIREVGPWEDIDG